MAQHEKGERVQVMHACPTCWPTNKPFCPTCLGVGLVTTERLARYQFEVLQEAGPL